MLSRIVDWTDYLSSPGDDEISAHILEHSPTGRSPGGERFVHTLDRITGRRLTRRPPGRKKKAEEK